MLTPRRILGPGGRIAARLPHYEHRDPQLEMADAVDAALRNGHHLVVEAGTGVGKSFGYLVPAILAATDDQLEEVQRVIVSTHTISLQEQLLSKDLPLLNSVIPREFSAVLAKGRGNYLSRRRLQNALQRSQLLFGHEQELAQLQDLRRWAADSYEGSLSDLDFRPWGTVWEEVQSDSGNCLRKQCPEHDQCFYFRARRRLENAQILVVNHALFFSDLALRQQKVKVLPDYQAVIFDEAHTLESVAADHLGLSITSGQVRYTLNKLYNDRTHKGLLVGGRLEAACELVQECQRRADEFFLEVVAAVNLHRDSAVRVTVPEAIPDPLSDALSYLADQLDILQGRAKDDTTRMDLNAAKARLELLADGIRHWVQQQVPDAVYWMEVLERRRGDPAVKLAAAPIEIGPLLSRVLFDKVRTVVLTSATLSTGRKPSFEFYKGRLGIAECAEKRLGSPFDYRRQAKLILVRDLPDPSQNREKFEVECIAQLPRYIGRTRGRAFCLFTSYAMLRRAEESLRSWLEQEQLALYSQADGTPRHLLLQRFKKNPQGVLLGTDSFWQGVDVPGDALQNVIITKLPFSVPDHPLTAARLDAIRAAGRSPFQEYQLPEAIIKLRQGFGRLIRTQQDHGMVVILDPRIRSKPYGRVFLESLPDCHIVEESALAAEASETPDGPGEDETSGFK